MTVRMRHTRSHSNNRRSHHALKKRSVISDDQGGLRLPHRIDEATGMYRGKLIVAPKDKKESKAQMKKQAEKEEQAVGTHEPAHVEAPKEKDEKKPAGGLMGRMTKGRANSRSGTGS